MASKKQYHCLDIYQMGLEGSRSETVGRFRMVSFLGKNDIRDISKAFITRPQLLWLGGEAAVSFFSLFSLMSMYICMREQQ